ncbi:MAG: outer membrane protein assembly factor BamA [Alphaproteobacteria bacterium]|nr:MAG: outer membrane protein assembly factor BamA [Alphaproteobacteria bacterium]
MKSKNSFLIIIILIFLDISVSFSNDYFIKKVEITGNKRIPSSFITNITNKYFNKKITDEEINLITKDLYKSDFFDDITVKVDNDTLQIEVIETPIINEIYFFGNSFFTEEQLKDIVKINKRDTFSKNKLNNAIERIKLQYSKTGRKFAKVEVSKKELSQSRVDLLFEITEGELVKVNNINFFGNKVFSNDKLKTVIKTKESKFYRLFGSSVFKEENIILDKNLLKRFYNRRGFIDFKVLSYKRELLPDYTGYNLNIILNEGNPFVINDILFQNELSNISKKALLNQVEFKKGDIFDERALQESIKNINNFFEKDGFTFIKLNYEILNKDNKNSKFDLKFIISEAVKSYVRRINITGNTRTLDKVLRRELLVLEGDPFNGQKLKDSLNALRRLGYFKSVNVEILKTETPGVVDVEIKVIEDLTGSFSFGIGYDSVEKTSFTIGLNEKNFLGKGLKTRISIQSSEKSTKFNLGITEPFFQDTPLSLSGDIFDQEIEVGDKDIEKQGFDIGFGFNYYDYINRFGYRYVSSKTTTDDTFTGTSISGEEGIEIETSLLNYSISSNNTDSFLNPTEGVKKSLKMSMAGVGGDAKFLKTEASFKQFIPFNYGDYIFSYGTKLGTITSLDDEKITSSNRFYFNSNSIRGFDSNGIGPRDNGNDNGVGGNNFYTGQVEVKSRKLIPGDLGIDISVFSDIGSLWDTDYPTNVKGVNDSSPRASAGVAIYWNTAVGPLSFIWGWPISEENYDKDNNFKFSIGTSF